MQGPFIFSTANLIRERQTMYQSIINRRLPPGVSWEAVVEETRTLMDLDKMPITEGSIDW